MCLHRLQNPKHDEDDNSPPPRPMSDFRRKIWVPNPPRVKNTLNSHKPHPIQRQPKPECRHQHSALNLRPITSENGTVLPSYHPSPGHDPFMRHAPRSPSPTFGRHHAHSPQPFALIGHLLGQGRPPLHRQSSSNGHPVSNGYDVPPIIDQHHPLEQLHPAPPSREHSDHDRGTRPIERHSSYDHAPHGTRLALRSSSLDRSRRRARPLERHSSHDQPRHEPRNEERHCYDRGSQMTRPERRPHQAYAESELSSDVAAGRH